MLLPDVCDVCDAELEESEEKPTVTVTTTGGSVAVSMTVMVEAPVAGSDTVMV